MTNEIDLGGRVRVLENDIHRLERTFDTRFSSLEKAIQRLSENVQGRPVTPPFKEIIVSIGATLAVMMTVASIIGAYVERTIELSAARSSGPRQVIEYRLDQIEKAREKPSTPQGLVMIPGLPRQ